MSIDNQSKREKGTLKLRGLVYPVNVLTEKTKTQMWLLFSRYYADVSRTKFFDDLAEKQYVICLFDVEENIVRGFSTIKVLKNRVFCGKKMTVIFSGDTVIHQDYWGNTTLQTLFARFLFWHKMKNPFNPVAWFLISKGYKTYLLLSRNFVNFWPRHDQATPAWIKYTIDTLALERFGSAYKSEQGLLIFDTPMGRLKENIAPIDTALLSYDDIRFFSQTNPGACKGDELCALGFFDLACMCHFSWRTLKKVLRKSLLRKKAAPVGTYVSTPSVTLEKR